MLLDLFPQLITRCHFGGTFEAKVILELYSKLIRGLGDSLYLCPGFMDFFLYRHHFKSK